MSGMTVEEAKQLALQQYGAGRFAQAEAICWQVLAVRPDDAYAIHLLGVLALATGRIDRAVELINQAIALAPRVPEFHINLGNVLNDIGLVDEALGAYDRALEIDPAHVAGHSNRLFAMHYHPEVDSASLLQAHLIWRKRHADPLKQRSVARGGDRQPRQRLRVGYVSADFCGHAVSSFLLPLLANHDRTQYEICCYANLQRPPDAWTDQVKALADRWRVISHLTDEQVADLVAEDGIDILVDLSLHSAGNRLLVFARKPAPVQVTYLAYCSTTGLDSIDYRLTDPYLDPPGQADSYYSETSIRLPHTYWCYQPAVETVSVNPLPAASSGQITFGCLNKFRKVSRPTLAAWGDILRMVPRSRLLMHAPEGGLRQRVLNVLAGQGVESHRVAFVGFVPLEEYFECYHRMDIALDPFPYGGGTTTCDALWMGVPVVTLAGRTAVGRGGVSILSNLGLTELIAHAPQQYIALAGELAGNLPRLGRLRSELRQRMRQSPIMDAPGFARDIEAAYRQMWHQTPRPPAAAG